MRTVIICGGNVGAYIKEYIHAGDFVICADSGYDSAKKYGIKPDLIIGDMDSVKSATDGLNTMIYPVRKDFTDSELALNYAKEHGADEILIFGATGTRLDHTLANISLLKQVQNAKIIDSHNEIYFTEKEMTLYGKPGDIVSILPFGSDIKGISTEGLSYALDNGEIKLGTSFGVSNEMTENVCRITIENGSAIVIRSKD